MSEIEQESQVLSRRRVLNLASASIGALVASPALADSLADVPPREPGADLSAHSERSKYVKIDRIPEAGPGMRNVDPDNAINAKTPHQKLLGSITPTDVHYERSHAGVPDIDPAQHRLLIHGMVQKPLVLSVDDLKAMPSVSRVVFIECTGNGWENWKKADPDLTHQIPDQSRRQGARVELDACGRRRWGQRRPQHPADRGDLGRGFRGLWPERRAAAACARLPDAAGDAGL
jgi:sulfane dehydrogenase subunit SoxC